MFSNLCASCDIRVKLDSHVDMYGTCMLLCGVRRAADLPALSGVLSGCVAAQRASERSGRGEPAASAGPRQPQPVAARTLPGYKPQEEVIPASPAHISVFFFFFLTFAGHWFVNQLWAGFRTLAAPLPLPPGDVSQPQKQKVSSLHSYPPSSTPQKWVWRFQFRHCVAMELFLLRLTRQSTSETRDQSTLRAHSFDLYCVFELLKQKNKTLRGINGIENLDVWKISLFCHKCLLQMCFYWYHVLLRSLRDESDGFVEQDNLLHQDSFGSGLRDTKIDPLLRMNLFWLVFTQVTLAYLQFLPLPDIINKSPGLCQWVPVISQLPGLCHR